MRTEIIYDLPRQEYDALPGDNWSSVRYILSSPAKYRHAQLNRQKDTAGMRMGRAGHVAVFEPERFRQQVVVWEGGVRRGKDWDAFRMRHTGQDILTVDEHAECVAVAQAARSDAMAAKYLSAGRGEVTLLWVDKETGLQCKGRPDFVADCGALVDLKTTRDASPGGFGRTVANLSYLGQAAFYLDGYSAVTGQTLPYVLVAAENVAPYVVQPYRLTDHQLGIGRDLYRGALQQLKQCRETSSWPGYATEELELQLPTWAGGAPEEDVNDFGLIIGGAANG